MQVSYVHIGSNDLFALAALTQRSVFESMLNGHDVESILKRFISTKCKFMVYLQMSCNCDLWTTTILSILRLRFKVV